MKKKFVIIVALLWGIAGCNPGTGSKDNKSYTLNGTLKGIPEGKITLSTHNEDDRTSKAIDSGMITNGSFLLKGKIGAPQQVSVLIEPGNWSFNIFLEDTVLTVTADTTGSFYYDYTKYQGSKGAQITKYTESGSRNFDDWKAFENNPLQKKYEPVFADLSNKITSAKDVDLEYHYRDQMDSVRKLLMKWKEGEVSSYISKNPSSVAGAYMLRNLYNFDSDMPLADMESSVGQFKGEAAASVYNTSLQGIIAKRKAVLPGSVAPDFTLLKKDSSSFTLSSTRGKYVMIDFWASWCHPCRQAIPHWKEVYAKYHDKGFDIVSVSDDSRWSDWMKAMDQEKMPWTQVCDEFPVKNMPAKIGSLYMTTYIPFYVLMDKEGKILVYSGDEHKIDEKLKEVFGS